MVWQPINLQEVCTPHSQLTACSSFAYLFFSLLTQFFGESIENKYKKEHEIEDGFDKSEDGLIGPYKGHNYKKNNEEDVVNREIFNESDKRQERDEDVYDFIVVGAGTAGCIVASRLSEIKDWRVLLLEAGPEQPEVTLVPSFSTALLGSSVDWKYRTQYDGKSCLAQSGQTCSWPRGKMMGGSSSINSFAYIRGNKLDFDNWAEMGNEGWSFKDVLPYFKKSENNLNIEAKNTKYHGVGGPQSISRWGYVDEPSIMMTEAFNQAGLPLTDYNGAEQYGTMQSQNIATSHSQRDSTNTAFIQPVRYKRKNLKVRTDSEVTEILIDPKLKKTYGVKYLRKGKWHRAIAKREIIVSGGAINSPKLLMLSGIGPRHQLKSLNIRVINNLPVGENLHDHITFNGVVVALSNKTSTSINNYEIIKEIKKYKKNDIYFGPLSGNGPVNSIGFYKSVPDLPAPDIQYQVDNVYWREYVNEPTLYDSVPIMPTAFYDGIIPRPMLLTPKSRGVLLLNTTDPVFGPPLLYPNYFKAKEDVEVLLAAVRFLLTLEKTKAFKDRGSYFVKTPLKACAHHPWGTDSYYVCMMRSYTSTPFHPVGTCKMGPMWDKGAVVDSRLRVYGVKGLRVIDASIMPEVTRGNTNAPTLMIGEKGADLVKEDWLQNYH